MLLGWGVLVGSGVAEGTGEAEGTGVAEGCGVFVGAGVSEGAAEEDASWALATIGMKTTFNNNAVKNTKLKSFPKNFLNNFINLRGSFLEQ